MDIVACSGRLGLTLASLSALPAPISGNEGRVLVGLRNLGDPQFVRGEARRAGAVLHRRGGSLHSQQIFIHGDGEQAVALFAEAVLEGALLRRLLGRLAVDRLDIQAEVNIVIQKLALITAVGRLVKGLEAVGTLGWQIHFALGRLVHNEQVHGLVVPHGGGILLAGGALALLLEAGLAAAFNSHGLGLVGGARYDARVFLGLVSRHHSVLKLRGDRGLVETLVQEGRLAWEAAVVHAALGRLESLHLGLIRDQVVSDRLFLLGEGVSDE